MKRLQAMLSLLILLTIPIDAAAQTLHRRPYTGDYGVTAHFDADGVKGNGSREDYRCLADSYDGHSGTDYALPLGSTVVASATGRVNRTNDGCNDYGGLGNTCGGYLGNWVEIVHPDGSFSMYAHMKRGSLQVRPGDQVECGQALGQSASSGSSTGPHLHYGSRSGSAGGWSISSTRDPYKGACARQNSLWTNQGGYQAPPGVECENQEVDVDIWVESVGVTDSLTQGSSADKADVLPGQSFEASIYVTNKSSGPIRGVELGYFVKAPFLQATDYVIESDAQGGEFAVNDSDAAPGNPAKDGMGETGALTLYAFAAGETKRVRITVTGAAPSIGEPDQDHPDVRGWIRNIDDVYAQDGFRDDPSLNNADERLVAFAEFDVLTTDYWKFDADEAEMLEGWTACDEETTAVVDPERGEVVVSGTGCLLSPPWTAIDAETVGTFVLDGAVSQPRHVTLSWRRLDDAEFEPGRSVEFEISAEATSAEAALAGHPLWRGTVAQLRLEVGEMFIDTVRFAPADVPEMPDVDTGPDGDNSDDSAPDDEAAPQNGFERDRVIDARGGCTTVSGRGGFAPALLFTALALRFGRRRRRTRHG